MKIAFAICTQSHLGFAITVRQSFLDHNEDYVFNLYLVDSVIDNVNLKEDYIFDTSKIGIPELEKMRSQYNVFELCCSLKPFIADNILKNPDVKHVFYFDTDMFIYNSFTIVEEYLISNDIVLTLHALRDEGIEHERAYIKTGIANGGFFAVKNSENGQAFTKWWCSKTLDQGYQNLFNDMFSDQLWLAYVPFYFTKVCIAQHVGLNVAVWNLRYRKVDAIGNKYFVNGSAPLLFFHYSGFKIDIENNSYSFSEIAEAKKITSLIDGYYNSLKNNKTHIFLQKYGIGNHAVKRKRTFYDLKMRIIGKIFHMSKNYLDYYRKK